MKRVLLASILLLCLYNLNAQLHIGFNGGITFSDAIRVKNPSPISWNGRYEYTPLLQRSLSLFVNYHWRENWIIEAQLGDKVIGYQTGAVLPFTPHPLISLGYPYPGKHPVHYITKWEYNYYGVSLRTKYKIAPDAYIALGINPIKIQKGRYGGMRVFRKRAVYIPNPDATFVNTANIFRTSEDYKKYNTLLELGVSYRIAKRFSLEANYFVSLFHFNDWTGNQKLYHSGISTTLVAEFQLKKPKFLSKKK